MNREQTRIKILHVDDEPDALASTKRFLERGNANFSVDSATSVEEGIELLNSVDYDVVLSDYKMPGMDGLEFLDYLRQSGSTVPFIMFTGKGREEVAMEALNKGANHYLQKGGEIKSLYGTLAHVIKDVVEKHRMEDALKKSEKEYQTIFETTGTATVIIEEDTTLSLVNTQFEELSGYSREEVEGKKSWTEFVVDEDLERMKEYHRLRRIDPNVAPTNYVFRFIDKAGNVKDVFLSIRVIPGTKKSVAALLDVTERKRAEAALEASEARFRSLVENIPDLIYTIDRNGTFTSMNEYGLKMLGYREEELIGQHFKEVIHPDDMAMTLQSFKKAVTTQEQKPSGLTFRLLTKDRRTIRVSLNSSMTFDAEGKYLQEQGVARDITERKGAEDALQESEERFRMLVEDAPFGISIMSPDLLCEYFNPKFTDMFGYTLEDLPDKTTWFEKAYPDEAYRKEVLSFWKKDVVENVTVGEAKPRVLTVRCKDGQDKTILLQTVVLRDGHHFVTYEDITARAEIEEGLKETEKMLSQIVHGSPIPTFVIDRTHTLIYWNRACETLTGLSADAMIGTNKQWKAFYPQERPVMADLIVNEQPEEVIATYYGDKYQKSVLIEGAYEALDFFPSLGARGKWLLFTAAPLRDSKGAIIGAIETLQDITERRQAEKEREQLLKELEAKNNELEHFTYTVSHDLQSPLFGIRGFTTLALEDLEQGDTENLANELMQIEKSAIKMENLLNDTLELSRIGRVAKPPEDAPFGGIVEEALEQTAGKLSAHNIEVSVADDFPTVHVDRMRIVEVLVNLIVNSINYRGEQPHPKIEIGHRLDGKETVFFVKDNGIGIDPSQHERVFDLFYKVNTTSTGTGAGLAIVKRIIEVHSGRIWIESEEGKGCTVCFTLPVQ